MNELTAILPPEAFRTVKDGKFKPKLSAEERCVALALVRRGVKRDVVAGFFGIDRRTVAHIANPSSPHYRETRNELKRLGEEDFIATYLTEDVVRRLGEWYAANGHKGQPQPDAASGRASKMAGLHTVKPEQCSYSHRVEIRFFKAGEATAEEGWHFRDLDGDEPDKWFHNGPESLRTSQSCFNMMVVNLVDAIRPLKGS